MRVLVATILGLILLMPATFASFEQNVQPQALETRFDQLDVPVSRNAVSGTWSDVGSGSSTGGGISQNSGDSLAPKIAVASDGTPYICWIDKSTTDWEIYVRRFRSGQWQEVGSGSASGGGISNNGGLSRGCTISIDSHGMPYVGWRDDSGGSLEVYVRRWNGSTWAEMNGSAHGGGVSNTTTYSGNLFIDIDNNDLAGITWNDQTNQSNEIFYRKWNGSSWVAVGGSSSGGVLARIVAILTAHL